jgi:long-chain acyl-CoA synthetase
MAKKKYPKGVFMDIPEFKTAREFIENGHLKGGDNKQYIYMETAKNTRTKSFNEVWYDSTGLGQFLYKHGMSEKKVAILSDNSYYWIICFYSILTGNNTAIPLDAKLMDDDIIDIMVRSQCDAIYYSNDFAGTIEKMKQAEGVNISLYMRIEDFYDMIAEGHADLDAGNDSYLDHPPTPDTLAAIVYTSGTTGRSKGVMLSHRNVTASVGASLRVLQSTHGIGFLPMNHTFAWASALFSSNVVIGWGYICRSLKDIPNDMKTYHPHQIAGVPLLVETIYKTIWRTAEKKGAADKLRKGLKISNFLRKFGIDVRRKLFKEIIDGLGGQLEYLVIGGAYLDPKIEKGMSDFGIEILNGYGTTECSPGITLSTMFAHKLGSCGKPMSCCEVKIHEPDEEGVGEIWVKGDNVMVGYYDDPEATASVFEDGWYKTGDYGRFDEDGFLFYVGRKKNLIVLSNGKNVSPEEIEDKIMITIPYVKEVVVSDEDNFITAEFFLDEEACPDAKERIKQDVTDLNRSLPVYKRILKVKTRDTEFPKTTTLKIKRVYKD